MPASRKSRKPRTTPVPDLTPADLAKAAAADPPASPVALTPPASPVALNPPGGSVALTPSGAPVALTSSGVPVALGAPVGFTPSVDREPVEPSVPASDRPAAPVDRAVHPKGGPPASGRGRGFSSGRPQRAGQGRQYAFRRS